MLSTLVLFSLVSSLRHVRADRRTDIARLGEWYTSLPLYRSGSGTNVLPVKIGSTEQQVNLTLTTNVAFVAVVGEDCQRCLEDADAYNSAESISYDLSRDAVAYNAIYPAGSSDTLQLNGIFGQDVLADPRGDSNPRPLAVISSIRSDPTPGGGGSAAQLTAGSSGFWGLGIFTPRANKSVLNSVLLRENDGRPKNAQSYTVGFDINTYDQRAGSQTGTIHWGGVPGEVYQGEFDWISPNTTLAGGWGFPLGRLRARHTVIDTSAYYGSLDPGYDAIYVPTRLAEGIFAEVPEAIRDISDGSRWNIPCDLNISMTVTISGHEYNVAASELVQPRGVAGRTCWSSIVAWSNGSLPEQLGEIRLGTPFLSGVYSAIYYNPNERYVGIAGKPGSVNALNVNNNGDRGRANGKLAGILIGSLLAALIILLGLCYSRNRNSFQSMWYRAIRRQHRLTTNAIVRQATMPPPMMMPTMPLMGPRPMGPMAPMGAMGPMGPMPMGGYPRPMLNPMGMMWGPPAYQHPIQPHMQSQQHPQQSGHSQQHQSQSPLMQQPQPQQQMPQTIDYQPQGIYSPRQRHEQSKVPAVAEATSGSGHSQSPHQYQGIPHPAHPAHPLHPSHQAQYAQSARPSSNPASPGQKVRSGQTASKAKHASYPSPSSQLNLARSPSRRVSTGSGAKVPRHDAWLQPYAGAGQDQQPYPDHKPMRVQTIISPREGAEPEKQVPVSDKAEKTRWSWTKRGSPGVQYTPMKRYDMAEGNALPEGYVGYAKNEKRKSWFGWNGANERITEAKRVKRNEKDRERIALARDQGGMYAA